MARPSRFSPEVRERAVRMVFEHRPNPRVAVGGDHLDRLEDRVHGGDVAPAGCGRPSVMRGQRPGLTTDERARLKQLERANVELRRANEILRLASAYFAKAELDRRAK